MFTVSFWTEQKVADLKRLRAEGLSASKIGLEIGTSGGSVNTKAKRLGLERRPDPIVRYGEEKLARIRSLRLSGLSIDKIASTVGCSVRFVKRTTTGMQAAPPPMVALPTLQSTAEQPAEESVSAFVFAGPQTWRENRTCQWVLSETGKGRVPLRCTAPATLGREGFVWCKEHRRRVYPREVQHHEYA
jgi:hypothetical protein